MHPVSRGLAFYSRRVAGKGGNSGNLLQRSLHQLQRCGGLANIHVLSRHAQMSAGKPRVSKWAFGVLCIGARVSARRRFKATRFCGAAACDYAMKAVVHKKTASHGVAEASLPRPAPGRGQVLVQVRAAAINPVDYKLPGIPIIGGRLQGKPIGLDFAGVVTAIAADVTTLKVGDEVFGNNSGTLAEFVCADAKKVAKKPPGISFEEAAALPTVALTSLQSLDKGQVGQGSRVLILGGSGGCGAMGVQIAKAMGAHVTSNCSAANVERVTKHGADVVIDYASQQIPLVPNYDCIYDTVTSPDSRDTNYKSLAKIALKKGGHYVAINGFLSDWLRLLMPRWLCKSNLVITKHNTEDLERIAKWVEQGAIRPQVQEVLPFSADGVVKGFELLKGRRLTGKLVFSVGQPSSSP